VTNAPTPAPLPTTGFEAYWAIVGDVRGDSKQIWGDHGPFSKGAECLRNTSTSGSVNNAFGNEIGVTCCDAEGVGSRPGCRSGVSFAASVDICRAANLTLCTKTQIQDGAGVETGCGFDAYLVWTADSCALPIILPMTSIRTSIVIAGVDPYAFNGDVHAQAAFEGIIAAQLAVSVKQISSIVAAEAGALLLQDSYEANALIALLGLNGSSEANAAVISFTVKVPVPGPSPSFIITELEKSFDEMTAALKSAGGILGNAAIDKPQSKALMSARTQVSTFAPTPEPTSVTPAPTPSSTDSSAPTPAPAEINAPVLEGPIVDDNQMEAPGVSWQDAVLARHNKLRSKVDKPCTASDMETMVWDGELAAASQKFADKCVYEHDVNSTQMGYGENMAKLTGANASLAPAVVAQMVQWWYNEIVDSEWSPSFDTMQSKAREDSSECYASAAGKCVTAHYANLVSAKANRIGCGVSNCGSKEFDGNGVFLVCRYSPVAIEDRTAPFQPGATCAACPDSCENNMCKPGSYVNRCSDSSKIRLHPNDDKVYSSCQEAFDAAEKFFHIDGKTAFCGLLNDDGSCKSSCGTCSQADKLGSSSCGMAAQPPPTPKAVPDVGLKDPSNVIGYVSPVKGGVLALSR